MRGFPPDLPGSPTDTPVDRALALLLAGELEAALRWSAAEVEQDASVPSALILTCRLLAQLGRSEAAIEGLGVSVHRSIDTGNLPLAVAAVADLRALRVPVDDHLDAIARAFCKGSARLTDGQGPPPPPIPSPAGFQPLSSFLTGPALLSKATAILHRARQEYDDLERDADTPIAPVPLFSQIDAEGLRALISAFEMITVPAGAVVIQEGEEGAEAYIVARGELEVRRSPGDSDASKAELGVAPSITLARLANGALFGEMALLSRAPRAASVVACRPSILLVARREVLEDVAAVQANVGVELAAHCRRRMVTNLLRTSPVLIAVDQKERPALVERFETRVFEEGDKLIVAGQEASGLHLIASGKVAVVGQEDGESFVISTLSAGEVVGEVALVFRRRANADVVAVHPTVTLHLPREDFVALIDDHPAILVGLYKLAIQRDEETSSVLERSSTNVADDFVLV